MAKKITNITLVHECDESNCHLDNQEQTEWIETIKQKVNQLNTINAKLMIPNLNEGDFSNPYGNGDTSQKIIDIIKTTFNF